MVVSREHKAYQELLKKGNGSILKGTRASVGGGKGMIALGISLLVIGLLSGGSAMLVSLTYGLTSLACWGVPGLILLVLGIRSKKKRDTGYLDYFKNQSMLTEAELQQFDREMSTSSVRVVTCSRPGEFKENYVAAVFGKKHVLINNFKSAVKRVEDVIAVAFSDSTDNWVLIMLTKQDEEAMYYGLLTDTNKKEALCQELIQEMCRINPEIIVGQEIVCEGRHYILERDSVELMRLYKQGYKLEGIN